MSRRKQHSTDSASSTGSGTSKDAGNAMLQVRLQSKWGYEHAIRRMSDGTIYELHKNASTEIQARHLQELAAQEPFLFQEN